MLHVEEGFTFQIHASRHGRRRQESEHAARIQTDLGTVGQPHLIDFSARCGQCAHTLGRALAEVWAKSMLSPFTTTPKSFCASSALEPLSVGVAIHIERQVRRVVDGRIQQQIFIFGFGER